MTQPVALVTNALEFAGPPAVEALRAAGFRVIVHDVAFAAAAERERYVNAHPDVVVLAEQAPEAVVSAAAAVDQRLDVLVSNDAFRAIQGSIEDAHLESLHTTLERLVVFPFALAKAAIPHLKAQPKSRVVFIASNRNRLPLRGGAIPDMARAGAKAMIKSLSIELAPHGIPVNTIAPNFLYSETYYPKAVYVEDPAGRAYVEQTVPMGRLAEPREIGELIRFLATMEGSFMTGAFIDFSGGWPAGSPRPA